MRSKGKKLQQFCCICCGRRLWPLGRSKQYLAYREELEQHSNSSSENIDFLSSKGTCIDHNLWVEEFFCGEHGKMWLLVSKQVNETLVLSPTEAMTRIGKLGLSAN